MLPPVARLAGTVTAPVVTIVEPELSVVVIAEVTTAEETDCARETVDQNFITGKAEAAYHASVTKLAHNQVYLLSAPRRHGTTVTILGSTSYSGVSAQPAICHTATAAYAASQ